MNANVTGQLARQDAIVPVSRHLSYIAQTAFERPTLVVDSQAVARQYAALAQGLGRARIHYAVKANPAPQILRRLTRMGANFDAASRAEIELCLAAGAKPAQITFGNTIKRPADIAFAHEIGITHFAADATAELEKLAQHAPGAHVCIRLLVEATGADWPLSRKFGCSAAMALSLMDEARDLGLEVSGLSFHVGSQTREPQMWADTLVQVAAAAPEATPKADSKPGNTAQTPAPVAEPKPAPTAPVTSAAAAAAARFVSCSLCDTC